MHRLLLLPFFLVLITPAWAQDAKQLDELDKLRRENKILAEQNKKLEAALDRTESRLKKAAVALELIKDDRVREKEAGAALIQKLRLSLEVFEVQLKRNQETMELLKKTFGERDKVVLKLEQELREAQAAGQRSKAEAELLRARLDSLLEDNIRLLKLLGKEPPKEERKEEPKKKTAGLEPNPPRVLLKGQITAVNGKDASLVTISLGADSGLERNQTLEVFRPEPPQYLGMIRIVELTKTSAVARRELPLAVPPLKVGDKVASDLGSR